MKIYDFENTVGSLLINEIHLSHQTELFVLKGIVCKGAADTLSHFNMINKKLRLVCELLGKNLAT